MPPPPSGTEYGRRYGRTEGCGHLCNPTAVVANVARYQANLEVGGGGWGGSNRGRLLSGGEGEGGQTVSNVT